MDNTDRQIYQFVGSVDKDLPSSFNLEDFYRRQEARRGRRLFDYQYIADPDPLVFPGGQARVSYLTEQIEESVKL